MARALPPTMTHTEIKEELLNGTLKGSTVDLARSFVESCTSSSEALRALMAVMCELDQIREAEQLELVLPAIASIEADSM